MLIVLLNLVEENIVLINFLHKSAVVRIALYTLNLPRSVNRSAKNLSLREVVTQRSDI